ncbi:MAG: MotA/TolQ/ExbB proton channel family protein [Flavobacteriales bacterium]|nr:MotA/TolQ/ExbB proton channel family protein [Flavobacteriales bacterium]
MNKQQQAGNRGAYFAAIAIPVALVVSYLIYTFVLGDKANFEGGDPLKGHPLNVMGTIHKGGIIVPFLIGINLIIIIFAVERLISLAGARGKGSIDGFIRTIRGLLNNGQVDQAIKECDKQRGSVAAVVRAGLEKYQTVANDSTLEKEAKVTAIKQELEEATSLELPMLSKNLVILSTCASISVLVGLIGTVLGMIKAFEAMANAGAPDTAALSLGISEALINTAFGIIGSCIAIIFFNYFSNRIDSMTYGMDEAGFSVAQNFASKH